jgi:hypothetical protein
MENKVIVVKPFILYLLLLFSGVAYYFLAYQTARENFILVFSLFTFLFAVFLIAYKLFSVTHFKYLIIAGIAFRVLLLFSLPNLSEDVYRFIWDGRLAANGINPFSYLPSEIMQMPATDGITNELYLRLNSVDHYTIYPPVLQGIFWSGAKLFSENVYAAIVFFKCIILLFEVGTFFVMLQILKKLSLPKHLTLLYILNPLVITELTGNAHFDGVMIFFVLLSFLLLLKNKWQASAIFLGLGIATKLLPVLFLPLIMNKLGWKKGVLYSIITGVTAIVLFALVLDVATIHHMLNSIDLYIRKFEFNASVYYVVRYIGTLIKGYNIIAVAGPFLILLSSLIILLISFKGKKISEISIFNKALLTISVWFLFSTTVHPWYICLPVAISIFTQYKYAMVWSYAAALSYYAYKSVPVKENLWLVALSYLIVAGYAFWEFKNINKSQYFKTIQ